MEKKPHNSKGKSESNGKSNSKSNELPATSIPKSNKIASTITSGSGRHYMLAILSLAAVAHQQINTDGHSMFPGQQMEWEELRQQEQVMASQLLEVGGPSRQYAVQIAASRVHGTGGSYSSPGYGSSGYGTPSYGSSGKSYGSSGYGSPSYGSAGHSGSPPARDGDGPAAGSDDYTPKKPKF